jgi:predicted transglutaminase-like cysteine proteinase
MDENLTFAYSRLKGSLRERNGSMTVTLAPMAWTLFERAPKPSKVAWLDIVNRMVNHGIDPMHGTPDVSDPWRIWPRVGWCHDYAVTKRVELLLRGYSASELLLCECLGPDGQHHVVLLVGGVALDNLTDQLLPMHYPVVRQQTAENPDLWQTA